VVGGYGCRDSGHATRCRCRFLRDWGYRTRTRLRSSRSLRGDTVGGLSGAGSYWARQHGYTESSGYISDALNCARCGGRLPVQR